jgi:hypothetical protein
MQVAVVNEPGMEDTGDDGTMDEEDEEDEEICWERVSGSNGVLHMTWRSTTWRHPFGSMYTRWIGSMNAYAISCPGVES